MQPAAPVRLRRMSSGDRLRRTSGGRSAVARCAPDEKDEPPKKEEEEEEREEGVERYLGYSAALARLKLVMLRAKTALATGAAKGAAAGGRE